MKVMTIAEYLHLCFLNELYLQRDWRITLTLLLFEYESKELYLRPDGDHYIFDYDGETYKLKDSVSGQPPTTIKKALVLDVGQLPNVKAKVTTSLGIWLWNVIAFIDQFGDKVPYVNEKFTPKLVNKTFYKLKEDGAIDDINKLLTSLGSIELLAGDSEFHTPAASPATLSTSDELLKRKDELLEEYKDQLQDPVIQAKIDEELIALDKEHVKGSGSDDFFISGKMHSVIRKKTMMMYGSETGIDGKPTDLIPESLDQGLNLDHMDTLVNVARSGSYSRGGLTALSGADVKDDYRMYGGLSVDGVNCKTKKGLTVKPNEFNHSQFVGMRRLNDDEVLTDSMTLASVGKSITIRVPGYCIQGDGVYCEYCMGEVGKVKKDAIASKVSDLDSRSMNKFMQLTHGQSREAITLDLDNVTS